MESMGNILNRINPLMNEKRTDTGKPSESENRREIIRRQLIAFYLGCRREVSSPEIMDMEIDLAMRDWEAIPTAHLEAACIHAINGAGDFMPTNGSVLKAWHEIQGDKKEAALKAIRAENTAKYLAPPCDDLPTPEQREENAAAIRALSEKLK